MLLTEFYKNKKHKLNFKKIVISESEIYPYFKKKYALYESEKFPQKMISGIRQLANCVRENKEAAQIAPFIHKLQTAGLGADTDIKIGDTLSVLDFEINYPYESIDVRGFTTPNTVIKIAAASDGTINYVLFENGDRYPRLTPAIYAGKPVDYAVYASDKSSAEKILTMLMLSVPANWEISTDELIKESKTDAISEALERTGKSESAVVGWGRGMGHKGHMYLASAVITQAKQQNADPYFVVSRTVGKDDPITPDEKLAIYRKVFPNSSHIFQTATDEMPDLTRVLQNLYKQGYKNVTVVVGADQKAALNYVTNYNGKPDKAGNILFSFDSLNVISRQETSDPSAGEEGPRATPMRAVLLDPTKSDEEKFIVWRDAMNPELTDDEVRDLMNKAQTRMQAVPVKAPKKAPAVKENNIKQVNALRFSGNNITDKFKLIEHVKLLRKWMHVEGVTPVFEINDVKKICSSILYEDIDIADTRKQFINKLSNLDQYNNLDIKIGVSVAIINAMLIGNYAELWGFTEPKRISKIQYGTDGNYSQFEFNDDPTDVYPRADLSTYNGKELQHSAFFGSTKDASQALTMLLLGAPNELEVRNHIKENANQSGSYAAKKPGLGFTNYTAQRTAEFEDLAEGWQDEMHRLITILENKK